MADQAGMNMGLYHIGRLYSEAFSGIQYEDILTTFKGVGRGDLLATIRLIALLHETSHYIHDLSLGTCLNVDTLLDEAGMITFELLAQLTRQNKVVCPLIDTIGTPTITSQHEQEALAIIVDRTNFADAMLYQPINLDTSSIAVSSDSGLSDTTTLTGAHLLEGLVAIKTLFSLTKRVGEDSDLEYLRDVAEELPLIPESLGAIYHLAPRLFDAIVGIILAGRNPRNLRSWPDDIITASKRKLVDNGFLYVADIALHVPPVELIIARIRSGQNTLSDFHPVLRFVKAMAILDENGAFPPAGSSGAQGFYEVLYNWLAARAGWPNYIETQGSWEHKFLSLRDKERRSISDGYRCRLLLERRHNSINILTDDATYICAKNSIPLIHLTPSGLKILRSLVSFDKDGTINTILSTPYEEMRALPVWELMNVDPVMWQDAPENQTMSEALELEGSRIQTFLQEIIMRSMCRSLQHAALKGDFLTCPWSDRGCHIAQPECREIRQLGSIPRQECALRKYVTFFGINPNQVIWMTKGVNDDTNTE